MLLRIDFLKFLDIIFIKVPYIWLTRFEHWILAKFDQMMPCDKFLIWLIYCV
jgi:hypothetical protein